MGNFQFQNLENGYNVIQLETAVGAAIKNFEGALGKVTICSLLQYEAHITFIVLSYNLKLPIFLYCKVSMFHEADFFQ